MLDLLMNRRSIRKYKDKEIDKNIIDQIIKGALTSPSGRNKRPWELIVITDKDTLKDLGDSRGRVSSHIADAPLGIVVIADPNLTDIWIEDASIMSTIIQLISHSLGLGTCWIQARDRSNQEGENVEEIIKDILKIPTTYRVESMIAIGYPDEEREKYTEESLPYDKIHYDKY